MEVYNMEIVWKVRKCMEIIPKNMEWKGNMEPATYMLHTYSSPPHPQAKFKVMKSDVQIRPGHTIYIHD